MRFEKIGPLGFLNWFHDDWLVTRLAMTLFVLATMIVLILIPMVFGWVNPNALAFWPNLVLGIFGVVAPIAIFFLMFGMWRFWLRVDDSGRWVKRLSFLALLVGIWWWYALCLYCWMVYLPKAIRKNRVRIQTTTPSSESQAKPAKITFTPGPFGKILIGIWAVFWAGVFVLILSVPFLKPGKTLSWFPAPWVFMIIMFTLILTSLAYGVTWLYRQGTRR